MKKITTTELSLAVHYSQSQLKNALHIASAIKELNERFANYEDANLRATSIEECKQSRKMLRAVLGRICKELGFNQFMDTSRFSTTDAYRNLTAYFQQVQEFNDKKIERKRYL